MATRAVNASAAAGVSTFCVQRRDEFDLEHVFFLSRTTRLGVDAGGISLAVDTRAHRVLLALGTAFKLAAGTVPWVGIVCVRAQRRHRFAERTVCGESISMRRNHLPLASLKT